MISSVSEMFNLHPQTLRLYEREGLLSPSRSEGNTRLYTEQDLQRLEVILSLTRDLGVNLAGIEIILNMRERMSEMEREMRALVDFIHRELSVRVGDEAPRTENALVRVGRPHIVHARHVRGS